MKKDFVSLHLCLGFCLLQWQAISLTVIEKVQIAAIILGSLFLIASISWLIWSSLSPSAKWQRQDLLFQICYGMYGFMDIVCIGKGGCTAHDIMNVDDEKTGRCPREHNKVCFRLPGQRQSGVQVVRRKTVKLKEQIVHWLHSGATWSAVGV